MTDQTTTTDPTKALVKPGYATTEFWVTLLTVLASVVGALDPSIHVSQYVHGIAAAAAAIATIAYTVSRIGIKKELVYLYRDYVQAAVTEPSNGGVAN